MEDFFERAKTEKRGRGTQRRDHSNQNRSSKGDEKQESAEKTNDEAKIPPTEPVSTPKLFPCCQSSRYMTYLSSLPLETKRNYSCNILQ